MSARVSVFSGTAATPMLFQSLASGIRDVKGQIPKSRTISSVYVLLGNGKSRNNFVTVRELPAVRARKPAVGPAEPSGMLWPPPYARGFGRRVGLRNDGGPEDAGCPA